MTSDTQFLLASSRLFHSVKKYRYTKSDISLDGNRSLRFDRAPHTQEQHCVLSGCAGQKNCSTMMKSILSLTALLIAPLVVGAGVVDVNNVDVEDVVVEEMGNVKKIEKGDIRRNLVKFDSEKLERDRQARMERQRQRRERAREKLATVKPDLSKMHRMTKEELVAAQEQDHPWVRRASWGSNSDYEPYDFSGMADPSQEYDKWQQAYRMLGGFIDCDHDMDDDNHSGSGDNDAQGSDQACSRWMMWAAVSFLV